MDPHAINPQDDDKEIEESSTVEIEAPEELKIDAGDAGETVHIPPISIGTVGAGDTLMATQSIINRQAERLDSLRDDLKKLNESMKSILDNDGDLSAAEMELKEASKKQKERKSKLAQSAESMQLKYKVSETRDQIKELEESLNNHLLSYYQLTGTKVFDTDSGEQREFRVTAKIMGKKSKHDREE